MHASVYKMHTVNVLVSVTVPIKYVLCICIYSAVKGTPLTRQDGQREGTAERWIKGEPMGKGEEQ